MTPKNGELSVGVWLGLFFGTVEKAIGSVIFLQKWPSPKITRGVKKQGYSIGGRIDWVSRAPFALLYLEKFVQIYCTMRFSAGPRGQPENWWLKSHQTKLHWLQVAKAALVDWIAPRGVHFLKDGCHVKLDTGSSTTNIITLWHVSWHVFM